MSGYREDKVFVTASCRPRHAKRHPDASEVLVCLETHDGRSFCEPERFAYLHDAAKHYGLQEPGAKVLSWISAKGAEDRLRDVFDPERPRSMEETQPTQEPTPEPEPAKLTLNKEARELLEFALRDLYAVRDQQQRGKACLNAILATLRALGLMDDTKRAQVLAMAERLQQARETMDDVPDLIQGL